MLNLFIKKNEFYYKDESINQKIYCIKNNFIYNQKKIERD
jgi:hypothetical protein